MSEIDLLHQQYVRYAPEFRRLFGVRLWDYWDHQTGFDLIKFDLEFVKTPDDTAMIHEIVDRFGSDAVNLIKKLIA